MNLKSGWILCYHFLTLIFRASALLGPPKLHEENELVTVSEGNQIRLPCPISANPEPFFEWTKDGKTVDETWPRYVLRRHFLKIRAAKKEDGGEFTCIAVNGFGQESFTFTLLVYKEKLPAVSAQEAPKLTRLSPSSPFTTTIGASLMLLCDATGVPRPVITWKKDDEGLHKTGSKLYIGIKSIFDSGIYSCIASNPMGRTHHNFSINVEENAYTEPNIIRVTNATAVLGSNTTLECIVRSFLQPQIQWLKMVEPTNEALSLPKSFKNRTLHRNGRTFRYISTSGSRTRTVNGTFVSTFFIEKVSRAHGGVYICVGATETGYNYKEVQLRVVDKAKKRQVSTDNISKGNNEGDSNTVSMTILMILLPASALLLVSSLVFLIYKLHHKSQNKTASRCVVQTSLNSDEAPTLSTPLHNFLNSKQFNVPSQLLYQVENVSSEQSTLVPIKEFVPAFSDQFLYAENTYLEPNYSDAYLEPEDSTFRPKIDTQNSEHSYERFDHSTLSVSPLPPPPYGMNFTGPRHHTPSLGYRYITPHYESSRYDYHMATSSPRYRQKYYYTSQSDGGQKFVLHCNL